MIDSLLDEPKTPSISRLHERVLGFAEPEVGLTQVELAEAQEIARTKVRPLVVGAGTDAESTTKSAKVLTSRRWSKSVSVVLAAAAACALAVKVWPRTEDDGDRLTPKGGTQVEVVILRGGETLAWKPSVDVREADRVQVSVLSPKAGRAFFTLVGRDGASLVPVADVVSRSVLVAAGERRSLPGAFELTGASDGEVAWVGICSGAGALVEAPEAGIVAGMIREGAAGCEVARFPLRP